MTLTENLSNLVIDLHDMYGGAFPRPEGMVIRFNVVHEKDTYQKARAEINALLDLHGLIVSEMTITPGPEVKQKWNRDIKFAVAKSLLT